MQKNLFATVMAVLLLFAFAITASASDPLDLSDIEPDFTQKFNEKLGFSDGDIRGLNTEYLTRDTVNAYWQIPGDGYYYPYYNSSYIEFVNSYYDFALEYDYKFVTSSTRCQFIGNSRGLIVYNDSAFGETGKTGKFTIQGGMFGSNGLSMGDPEGEMEKGKEYTIRVEKIGNTFSAYAKEKNLEGATWFKVGSYTNALVNSTPFAPRFQKAYDGNVASIGVGNISFYNFTLDATVSEDEFIVGKDESFEIKLTKVPTNLTSEQIIAGITVKNSLGATQSDFSVSGSGDTYTVSVPETATVDTYTISLPALTYSANENITTSLRTSEFKINVVPREIKVVFSDGVGEDIVVLSKDDGTVIAPECASVVEDKFFFGWLIGNKMVRPGETYTLSSANDTLVAQWKDAATITDTTDLVAFVDEDFEDSALDEELTLLNYNNSTDRKDYKIISGKLAMDYTYNKLRTRTGNFKDLVFEFDMYLAGTKNSRIWMEVGGGTVYADAVAAGDGTYFYKSFHAYKYPSEDSVFSNGDSVFIRPGETYTYRVEKFGDTVSFYVKYADAPSSEYVFVGSKTNAGIADLTGHVDIQSQNLVNDSSTTMMLIDNYKVYAYGTFFNVDYDPQEDRTKVYTSFSNPVNETLTAANFSVTDPEGTDVEGVEISVTDNEAEITLPASIAAGTYVISLIDAEKLTTTIDGVDYGCIGSTEFIISVPEKEAVPPIIEPENETYVLGDANSDGSITAGDAATILQGVAKIIAAPEAGTNEFAAWDANKDGGITAGDAAAVLQYVAKILTDTDIGKEFGASFNSETILNLAELLF